MEWKIVVAVFASVFLLSAMFGARLMVPADASITPHPAQSIWVEPSFVDNLQKCYTFTIKVMVNITDPPGIGTGLFSWNYVLKWNSTVLDLTSYTIDIPPEWGIHWTKPKDEVGHYPNYINYHWLTISATFVAPPLTGVRSLCTYNFRVVYQPYYPEPDYNGTLDLQQTELFDEAGVSISHITYDGNYRIPTKPFLIPGDVNDDGIVDIHDVVIAAVAFGSRLGDSNWDSRADLNCDGLIDIFDMVIIGTNYGKTG